MGFEKQEMPMEPVNQHWLIYGFSGKPIGELPLVIAAYQYEWTTEWDNRSYSTIHHIFANDPQKTAGRSMEELLRDAEHTAMAISEAHIYPSGRSDAGAALLECLLGLIGGAAAGFGIWTAVSSALSHYFGVEMPPHSALVPTVLGGAALGTYMYERPEAYREMCAAKSAIGRMGCPPETFLHGAPAVAVIERYLQLPIRT